MKNTKFNHGATLVEMVAALVLMTIVIIGVMQFLLVSRLNVYTSNVRAGVMQILSDTISQYQFLPPGTSTNIPVSGDMAVHIVKTGTDGAAYVQIDKSATPLNGTYTVHGAVTWKAFPNGNGQAYLFTENLSLQIPQY
jgi:type II secretory pathway pseudopilin PulG